MMEEKEEILLQNIRNNNNELVLAFDPDVLFETKNEKINQGFEHEELIVNQNVEFLNMKDHSHEEIVAKSLELLLEDPSLSCVLINVAECFESLSRDNLMMFLENLDETRYFLIAFKSQAKSFFYWRFGSSHPIFELEIDCSENLEAFIVNVLRTSIISKHNGLLNSFQFDENAICVPTELFSLGNSQGFNLLSLASESSTADVVKELIEAGFDVHVSIDGKTAADIAYASRNHAALLKLLEANSLYPTGFDLSTLDSDTTELKSFVELSTNLHDSIKSNDQEVVREILESKKGLKHFYDTSNNSAVTCALANGRFQIFEILTIFKIIFGPKEDFDGIMDRLNEKQKRFIRKIHEKHSQSLLEKHLSILVANSSLGHDAINDDEKLSKVARAFRILNENPLISIILKIVAASRNFKIIFDFKRENVRFLDPNSEPYTNGLFYESGRILIGARFLLDNATEHIVFGVLAHELTHFAMFVVFQNMARPYTDYDKDSAQTFNNILLDCEKKKELEEIIELVFDYPSQMTHAELIVRIPHILAHYYNNAKAILNNRINFGSLFIYYENVVVPKLEQALPNIEGESEKEIKGKYLKADRKLSQIRWSFVFTMFVLILLGPVCFVLLNPAYIHWNDLTSKQQTLIMDNNVTYRDVVLKFSDLFNSTPDVYQNLTQDQIISVLHYDKNLTDEIYKNNFHSNLNFSWKNLPQNLRSKVRSSMTNFQGELVSFDQMLDQKSEAYFELSPKQIDDALKNKIINVGSSFISKIKFIERVFLPTNDKNTLKNEQTSNETKLAPSESITTDQVLSMTEELRIFILSDGPGTGKSAVFENLLNVTKHKYPTRWIAFVELKKHRDAFKKAKNGKFEQKEDIVGLLADDILKLNSSLEREIFSELFNNDKVILIWDALDEVSPEYEEFLNKLFRNIQKNTKILQFISTRPEYAKNLSNNLQRKLYKIGQFTKDKREVYLKQILSERVQGQFLNDTLKKVQDFIAKEESGEGRDFNRPIILQLLADAALNPTEIDLGNRFIVFKAFVDKQLTSISCYRAKNAPISKVNPYKMHQIYALKLIFEKVSNLDIMKEEKFVDKNEMASYGLLTIFNDELEFIHRTFAEFFIAQYLIFNIYNLDYETSESEMRERLFILEKVFSNEKVIRDFIGDYLKYPSIKSDFKGVTKKLVLNDFKKIMKGKDEETSKVMELFFEKDKEILMTLQLYGGKFGTISDWLKDKFHIKVAQGISMEEDSSDKITKSFLENSQMGNIVFQIWHNLKEEVTLEVLLRALNLKTTGEEKYSQLIDQMKKDKGNFYRRSMKDFYENNLKDFSEKEKHNLICDNFGDIFIDKIQNYEEFSYFWSIFNTTCDEITSIIVSAKNRNDKNILYGVLNSNFDRENIELIIDEIKSYIDKEDFKMLIKDYEMKSSIYSYSNICKIEELKLLLSNQESCDYKDGVDPNILKYLVG